MRRAVVKFLTR